LVIRFDLNQFETRFFFSLLLYLFFILSYFLFGFYNAFLIVLTPSIIFIFYLYSVNGINYIDKKTMYITITNTIYFIIFIYLFPPYNYLQLEQAFIKVIFEELFFRFCMIGIVRKYLSFLKMKKTIIVLITNSLLFSFLHMQYVLLGEYSIIFIQGVNFGLTFLSIGIFSSIYSHLLWNLYFPNIIPQLPIFILAAANIIYLINLAKRESKKGKIMHLR